MLSLADPIQMILLGWALVGLVVAAGFLLIGVDRIDPAAHGAWSFRIAILPGVVILWPVVVVRWSILSARNRPA